MSDALRLPPRPNLEQYRKLAKDFQSACKSGEPLAVHNAASQWLKRLYRLSGREITPETTEQIYREARRVERSWNSARSKNASRCTLADAQFFVARQHGFASWPKFSKHIIELRRSNSNISLFETAVEAIITGDVKALKKTLKADSNLIRARSTREHRSTLLHYVSANGVEDFRQKTPKNIVDITKVLLDAGAEVDAESDAYGGGCTTLGLVATSIHPEQAGVQIPLIKVLLAAGAEMDHRSSAGHGHSLIASCLANGQPQAAEFLAGLGAPLDLEGAAGLGRLEKVSELLDDAGTLKLAAARKEMKSAFFSACWWGREHVVKFFLERGVDPNLCDDSGKNGLHCTAFGANTDVARVLLHYGTLVDVREQSFQATPLDVALWAWGDTRDESVRERSYDFVALLVKAGSKLDPKHWTSPDGTSKMLEAIGSDTRMETALKGQMI